MTRNRWQTVPVEPDTSMALAFAAEIRRQAARLPPGSTAHEPLEPLWAAVLAAAPRPPEHTVVPVSVPRTTAEGWNAAVAAMLDISARSAAMIGTMRRRPIAEAFAIAALTEMAEAGRALLIVNEADQPILPRSDAKVAR